MNIHAPGSMTPVFGESVTGFHCGKFSNITGSTGRNFNIPCSMKILQEFYFADWRFFVVCGNKFLQFEKTEISGGTNFWDSLFK